VLTVSDSTLTGTYGDVASAFYATADSNLNLLGMRVENLDGPERCTFEKAGVVVADMAKLVTMENTRIARSGCSYVYSDRSSIEITNSEFDLGR